MRFDGRQRNIRVMPRSTETALRIEEAGVWRVMVAAPAFILGNERQQDSDPEQVSRREGEQGEPLDYSLGGDLSGVRRTAHAEEHSPQGNHVAAGRAPARIPEAQHAEVRPIRSSGGWWGRFFPGFTLGGRRTPLGAALLKSSGTHGGCTAQEQWHTSRWRGRRLAIARPTDRQSRADEAGWRIFAAPTSWNFSRSVQNVPSPA